MLHEKAFIGGYVCRGSQRAAIFRPDVNLAQKFPLLSYAHGFGGSRNDDVRVGYMKDLVSQGYIVIANMSATGRTGNVDNRPCGDMYKD